MNYHFKDPEILTLQFSFTAAEEQELQQRMQRKQMTMAIAVSLSGVHLHVVPMLTFSAQQFNKTIQTCFESCVSDFGSKQLSSREEGCLSKCMEKLQSGMQRMSMRFQEANEMAARSGGAIQN
jgi:import inner membrane translocase subunit TIM9